ncbi:hypothetical protein TSUD_162440 [Trifolium subterraneum]|uniref:Uncharacterized protein n=1 Tax=Trifolium subterraneum TaxID=3900 RepID=A0A2Z6NG67_TRISU|nr:hypothetical protein TSUD_162440 [Trifolium subterraneum]
MLLRLRIWKWIRCGLIKVKYLPKRVLQQFGYVQTISCDPDATAIILTTEAPTETTTQLLGSSASIHDILNGLMIRDEVPNGSRIYKELKSAYTLTFVSNQGALGSSSRH